MSDREPASEAAAGSSDGWNVEQPPSAARPGGNRQSEFEPTLKMPRLDGPVAPRPPLYPGPGSDVPPVAVDGPTDGRPLVASRAAVHPHAQPAPHLGPSAVERYDTGSAFAPRPAEPRANRDYLRRLEPTPVDRNWSRILWPVLGVAVIAAGAFFLLRYRAGNDVLAGGLVNPTVDQMAQATVQIQGLDADNNPLCSGSGTFVSTDGMILTNAHVVTRDSVCDFVKVGIAVTTDAGQPPELRYEADLLTIDAELDLAVIRVARPIDPAHTLPPSFLALSLGDSDEINIGDALRIFGYPEIGGDTITFTDGAVSGFTAQAGIGDRALIKTNATIAGGNSGGAAVDLQGRLVGIPTKARASESGPAVDCRPLADTNNDGIVDTADSCVTIGGFLNGLRPVNLARPVIEAARSAEPRPLAGPTLSVAVDPGTITMTSPRFSLGETDNKPDELVRTAVAGIGELCLFVDWAGIPDTAEWDAVWFVDKKPVEEYSLAGQTWEFGAEGVNFWMCAVDETDGLPAGLYELGFFVGGHLIFAEGIVVTPQPVPVRETTWHNVTTEDVCSLAINPRGSGPVGLNELPVGEVIPPDGTVTVALPEGELVVEAYNCNGEPVADSGGDGGVAVTPDTTAFVIDYP